MKKMVGLVSAAALLPLTAMGVATAAPAEKVDVCHLEGNGSYHLINISENAYPTHVAHGDANIGDFVPGTDETKVFDETCQIVDAPVTRPMVTEGAPSYDKAGAARWKGTNSGGEFYVGQMTTSSATPRVESNVNWADGTYPVSLALDPAENTLTGTVGTQTLAFDYDTSGISASCAIGDADVMHILVRDGRGDAGLAFSNVTLNGTTLGGGTFGTVDVSGTSYFEWGVTGADLGSGFTLAGDLTVQNFVGNEGMKLDIAVGCQQ